MKRANYQNIAIITFAVILCTVASYLIYNKHYKSPPPKTYENSSYGISFLYPAEYELKETPLTEGQVGTLVTLINGKEKGSQKSGQDPTSITVAMYDSAGTTTPKQDPLETWIRTSPYSNFTLSAQTPPGETTVGGKTAFLYTWDGLYHGTTVVTLFDDHIFMFTVTYAGNSDMAKNLQDFTRLMESVQWIGIQ